MKTIWFKGKEPELEKEIRMAYRGGVVLRRRLREMLNELVDSSTSQSRSKLSYESPNWALQQADQRGYERALVEIIGYLQDDDKEN